MQDEHLKSPSDMAGSVDLSNIIHVLAHDRRLTRHVYKHSHQFSPPGRTKAGTLHLMKLFIKQTLELPLNRMSER